jgi:hypothetical protein
MWNSKFVFSSIFSITLLFFCLSAHALTVGGNQVADLPWGESFVDVYDTSTLNINNGVGASFIDAYEQSTINANEAGRISWLNMRDNSTANIYSGDYSWIRLFDNSTANLFGDMTTSWFLMEPDTQVNVFGSYLDYSNGRVTGMATDGGYYSIGLLAVDINGNFLEAFPTNVTLNSVPLPAPLVLFFSGLVVLARLGKSKGIKLFSKSKQMQAVVN